MKTVIFYISVIYHFSYFSSASPFLSCLFLSPFHSASILENSHIIFYLYFSIAVLFLFCLSFYFHHNIVCFLCSFLVLPWTGICYVRLVLFTLLLSFLVSFLSLRCFSFFLSQWLCCFLLLHHISQCGICFLMLCCFHKSVVSYSFSFLYFFSVYLFFPVSVQLMGDKFLCCVIFVWTGIYYIRLYNLSYNIYLSFYYFAPSLRSLLFRFTTVLVFFFFVSCMSIIVLKSVLYKVLSCSVFLSYLIKFCVPLLLPISPFSSTYGRFWSWLKYILGTGICLVKFCYLQN